MVASSNPSPALWLYVALSPNVPCHLSSMGSMTVLHIPDVVLHIIIVFVNYQETLLVKVFELSVYHAEHSVGFRCSFMKLSGYLQCACCENSQITVFSYFLYVPVSIILMNHVVRFVLMSHVHNFALVWVTSVAS